MNTCLTYCSNSGKRWYTEINVARAQQKTNRIATIDVFVVSLSPKKNFYYVHIPHIRITRIL